MKVIAVLFAILSVVFAIKQENYKIPEDRIAKMKAVSDACAQEYNVDPDTRFKIPEATVPRGEAYDKYLYCALVKSGIALEDGHINIDKLAGLVGDHPITEELKASFRKCNEVTKENAIETLVAMNRCVIDTAPVHFIL